MYETLISYLKNKSETNSYPWVFLKALLETVNDEGMAPLERVCNQFKCFYRERFREGLMPEVKTSPIYRLKMLDDRQILAIMLEQAYEPLSNYQFVSLREDQMVVSELLWDNLRHDMKKIKALKCLEDRIHAYYQQHFGNSCIFCNINAEEMIFENQMAFATDDAYPATPGHMLVIPKRHFQDISQATEKEVVMLFRLVEAVRKRLMLKEKIDGFNIGINGGRAAGQSVMHLHIHVMPRRWGDVEKPRGGVRNILRECGRPKR